MKIHKLCFENLNSLYGKYTIDFDNENYLANGLFLITGPTGAGKTTIFDAICLALYGKTPRLDGISKSRNDIMSHDARSCFAELIFSTETGTYRAYWSQSRTRPGSKEPFGQSKCEFSECDPVNFESKGETLSKKVQAAIEEVLKTSFEQFTRSLLLAQGEFDNFLHSKSTDRAEILEQITGTEIYGEISKAVHARNNEEKLKLQALNAERQNRVVLSGEEIASLNTQIETSEKIVTEKEKHLEQANRILDTLERMKKLREESELLQQKLREHELERKNFEPDRELLSKDEKAVPLQGEYLEYSNLERQLNEELIRKKKHEENLEQAKQAKEVLENDEKIALSEFDAASTNREKNKPLIEKAKKLDLEIKTKRTQIDKIDRETENFRSEKTEKKRLLEKEEKILKELESELEKAEQYRNANQVDFGLIAGLDAIRTAFESLQKMQADRDSIELDHQETLSEKENAENERLDIETKFMESEKTYKNSEKSIEEARNELEKLLESRELPDWRGELEQAGEELVKLESLNGSFENKRKILEQLRIFEGELKELEPELEKTHRNIEECKKDVSHLEEKKSLEEKIADLEDLRRELIEGKECPLCGSKHHPFAEGNIPEPSATKTELETKKSEFENLNHLERCLLSKKAGGETASKIKRESLDKTETEIEQIRSLPGFDIAPEFLEEKISELKERKKTLSKRIENIEKLQQEEKKLQNGLESIQTEHRKLENEKNSVIRDIQALGKKLEDLKKRYDKANSDYVSGEKAFRERTAPFGEYGEEFEMFIDELANRRIDWERNEGKIQKSKNAISEKNSEIALLKQSLETLSESISKQTGESKAIGEESTKIQAERTGLLGDENPDELEKSDEAALDSTRERLSSVRNDLAGKNAEIVNFDTEMQKSAARLIDVVKSESEAKISFLKNLEQAGFESIDAFKKSLLSPKERERINSERKRLDDAKTTLETALELNAQNLETEKNSIPERTDIETERNEILNILKEHREIVTINKQRLEDDKKHNSENLELETKIDEQKKSHEIWGNLNGLIGSFDGAKFRNFAQGLVFENIVRAANSQLEKMSDRYLLVRKTDDPLDLCIKDNYHAGEIRSINNLSGGECFIISLALAIGLSNFSSGNVKSQVLFLDEGFGTLDPEMLETALQTLVSLQEQGKLIGLISHVELLKDRLPVQLLLEKKGAGRSTLNGPGVTHG